MFTKLSLRNNTLDVVAACWQAGGAAGAEKTDMLFFLVLEEERAGLVGIWI